MIVSLKDFFGPIFSWLRITSTANQPVKIHPKPRQNAKLDAKCRSICDWTDIRGGNHTFPVQLTMFLTTTVENDPQKSVSAGVPAAFCNQRNLSAYDWTSLTGTRRVTEETSVAVKKVVGEAEFSSFVIQAESLRF